MAGSHQVQYFPKVEAWLFGLGKTAAPAAQIMLRQMAEVAAAATQSLSQSKLSPKISNADGFSAPEHVFAPTKSHRGR